MGLSDWLKITEQVSDGARIQTQAVWLQSKVLKCNRSASWERQSKGSVMASWLNEHRHRPPQFHCRSQQYQTGNLVPDSILWGTCCYDTVLLELCNDSRDGGQREELERLLLLLLEVPETTQLQVGQTWGSW